VGTGLVGGCAAVGEEADAAGNATGVVLMTREDVDALFSANHGLIACVVNRIPCDKADVDDLRNAALLGLWMAAKNFDASKGFAFSTFAVPWIRNMVLRRRKELWRSRMACACMTANEVEDLVDRYSDETEDAYRREAASLALGHLSDRKKRLVQRWMADEPLGRIAKDFNVTIARIRELLQEAMCQMRSYLRDE
jgi:RNA polymerase sigma factor (sigma-70 family)